MRHLSVVILTVLLSLAVSGVASAQTDSSSDRENLEWQRQVIEAAIAQTQAELAAVEGAPDDPDVTLVFQGPGGRAGGWWYPLDRAEVEVALQIIPVYELASPNARRSLEDRLPELEPALRALSRSLSDDLTLAALLVMDEAARWKLVRSKNQRGSQLGNAAFASGRLKVELSDLQGLLAAVDDELAGLRPLQPDQADEDSDDTPAVDDSPDDTPVVDEPQEEPSDTSTEVSGFAGTWSTRAGNRMELTGSGSSFKGPYGRMQKADENGVRTLGVIGDMDMKVTGERTLEGFWIKGSASSARCKSPREGSYYWGQQLMVFDEAFMSWKGGWSYCDREVRMGSSSGGRIQEP